MFSSRGSGSLFSSEVKNEAVSPQTWIAPLLSSVSGFLQFLYQTSRANRRRRVSVADVWHWAKPSSAACRVAALEFFGGLSPCGITPRGAEGGDLSHSAAQPLQFVFPLPAFPFFFTLFGGP